ncbi:hypothetical protein [Ruegeria atlantica]|uniref:hypothetical protein n=1 Tax=Ruegeria atlantica TaxID=81569 RepID=UPI0011AE8CCC|nr:hypothetical protein [Ruegeria atlantica]
MDYRARYDRTEPIVQDAALSTNNGKMREADITGCGRGPNWTLAGSIGAALRLAESQKPIYV